MHIPRWVAVAALSATLATTFTASADDQSATIAALLKRIEELEKKVNSIESNRSSAPSAATTPPLASPVDQAQFEALQQQVKVIERKDEIATEAATEKAKTAPVISLGVGGLTIRTPDTNFVFRLRGYAQAQGRIFPESEPGQSDTFLMRRVRPIFEGTVYERFDYRVMLDLGSNQSITANNNSLLQDAYVNALIYPWLQLRAGKDKEPVGLERLQSGSNLLFAERAFPTLLVPNRDVGFQARGEAFKGTFEYQLGVFNGTANGGSGDLDTDSDKDFAGRVFTQPFKNSDSKYLRGLGVGMAGTYGNQNGPLRTYLSPAQQRLFAYYGGTGAAGSPLVTGEGQLWRFTPQGWYYYGPFGLFWEWVTTEQELARTEGPSKKKGTINNRAWQLAGSYFLTGEDNGWKAVTPLRNLNFTGDGWGAFELAARVSQLNLDDGIFPTFANPATSINEAFEWQVGINWYLNRNIKLTLDYSQTAFEGGHLNPIAANGEKIIFTQVQFSW